MNKDNYEIVKVISNFDIPFDENLEKKLVKLFSLILNDSGDRVEIIKILQKLNQKNKNFKKFYEIAIL